MTKSKAASLILFALMLVGSACAGPDESEDGSTEVLDEQEVQSASKESEHDQAASPEALKRRHKHGSIGGTSGLGSIGGTSGLGSIGGASGTIGGGSGSPGGRNGGYLNGGPTSGGFIGGHR